MSSGHNEDIEEQVKKTLIALLEASESDSVRVAAAKALLDRIDKRRKNDAKENEESAKEKARRQATIEEAFNLVSEITDLKSGSNRCTDEMDKDCTD